LADYYCGPQKGRAVDKYVSYSGRGENKKQDRSSSSARKAGNSKKLNPT
jgi:hypothetical protein